MPYTNCLNNRRGLLKKIILVIILINFIIPLLIIGFGNINNTSQNTSHIKKNSYSAEKPKTQGFSINDYHPMMLYEQSALGAINISNLDFDKEGYYNNTNKYPQLQDDIDLGALKLNYLDTKFVEMIEDVSFEDYNGDLKSGNFMKLKLNDSISIQYDYSIQTNEGYLFYMPKLSRTTILELWIENESAIDQIPLTKLNSGNYSLGDEEGSDYIVFFYKNFLGVNKCNFTLHIIYELEIVIDTWQLNQDNNQELLIEEDETLISPKYYYTFNPIGYEVKYKNESTIWYFDQVDSPNLRINFSIYLPNRDLLYNHKLFVNNKEITANFLRQDKSIYTNLIHINFSSNVKIEFITNFIMDFVEPVDFSWSIDRLVEDDDIRERIFFPRIISGPSDIYLKNVKFIDESIAFDQVISGTSLFGRPVVYSEVNVSKIDEDLQQSLIFNEYSSNRRGLKLTIPYMIRGEICPFIIRYETNNDLKIVITDNIGMPLTNYEVKIYYYGQKYGTYISKDFNQPIGPTITDENGEILLKEVPNGNFTVEIYYWDQLIMEAEVSSFIEINYIKTSIIHFPLVILIVGGIFASILGLGIFLRSKYRD